MILAYLAEPKYGGWVTFTAHLALSLEQCGVRTQIRKEGKATKPKEYSHGLCSFAVPQEALIHSARETLITAVDKHNLATAEQMLMNGAAIVLHDPNEFHPRLFEIISRKKSPVIAIRETVKRALAKHGIHSTVIAHPFTSQFSGKLEKTSHACSYSRVDFDKHTEIIIEANKSLGFKQAVKIYGAMNRMYEYLKLREVDSNWQRNYYGIFPLAADAAERIAAKNLFTVDLSIIKNDGGGTQYTFLEAWAQGSHLIVHRKWLLPDDVMQDGVNCTAISSAAELVKVLSRGPSAQIIEESAHFLEKHSAKRVIPQLQETCKFE